MATETNDGGFEDNYRSFTTAQQALEFYDEVTKRENLYIASVVASVESTDYDSGTFLVVYTIRTRK